jgi:hypothetical protein
MRLKWQAPHELSVLAPLKPFNTAIPTLPLCAARLSDASTVCYHAPSRFAADVSVSCDGHAPIATRGAVPENHSCTASYLDEPNRCVL